MILIGLLRHLRLLLFLWQPLKCTLRACALKHIKDILQFSAGSAGRVFLCFFFIIFNCFFFLCVAERHAQVCFIPKGSLRIKKDGPCTRNILL